MNDSMEIEPYSGIGTAVSVITVNGELMPSELLELQLRFSLPLGARFYFHSGNSIYFMGVETSSYFSSFKLEEDVLIEYDEDTGKNIWGNLKPFTENTVTISVGMVF